MSSKDGTVTERLLQAPFPWFGGKSRVASLIWQRLGDVPNLVDPFMGSLAVILGRPGWDVQRGDWKDDMTRTETVNDKDAMVANFYRAMQAAPAEVAKWADQRVDEAELTAAHIWLVKQRVGLTERVMADRSYYDAEVAGLWCWGLCCWIGSGWCSGEGPWTAGEDGQLVHLAGGQGVNRQRVHLGNAGQGVNRQRAGLQVWFAALSARLRRVRVCCGDWTRVLGPSSTTKLGLTAVVLDPPYSMEERDAGCYAVDTPGISDDVRRWAIEHGDDPLLRIVYCSYGEQPCPDGWERVAWKAQGGYGGLGEGRGRDNAGRETLDFSPHCLKPQVLQPGLFDLETQEEEEEDDID